MTADTGNSFSEAVRVQLVFVYCCKMWPDDFEETSRRSKNPPRLFSPQNQPENAQSYIPTRSTRPPEKKTMKLPAIFLYGFILLLAVSSLAMAEEDTSGAMVVHGTHGAW